MKYASVIVSQLGGPEVLQVVSNELRPPAAAEVRVRVLAALVSRPDVTLRRGESLYEGTPLGHKPPYVPGYAIVGCVDAVGEDVRGVALGARVGVLSVVGGYSEYSYWKPDCLIPVPAALDPAEAVTLLLNYLVAYQVLHRSAKVVAGEKALIIGASGGIGTALLQLGQLAGLRMYGLASAAKHATLAAYGATPIDYRTQDFVSVLRQAEPQGIDVVLDGMMRLPTLRGGLSLLRRGGRLVAFGEPDGFSTLLRVLGTALATNLRPSGKSIRLYGTSFYSLGAKQPFLDDWATLFDLLEAGKIKPILAQTFPLLEAGRANALLESGKVTGQVVLVAPQPAHLPALNAN